MIGKKLKEYEIVKKIILKIISNKKNTDQNNWNQIWQMKKIGWWKFLKNSIL